jgi:hypothetical protein
MFWMWELGMVEAEAMRELLARRYLNGVFRIFLEDFFRSREDRSGGFAGGSHSLLGPGANSMKTVSLPEPIFFWLVYPFFPSINAPGPSKE